MVTLEDEDWKPQSMFRVGIWTVTLALPFSQIGITMLVSVENLEEAGEHVSFWLQIRRYWAGGTRCRGTQVTSIQKGVPGCPPFRLSCSLSSSKTFFLSLGAPKKFFPRSNLCVACCLWS